MKKIFIPMLCLILLGGISFGAGITTLVLQNGRDGYTGCSDAYIDGLTYNGYGSLPYFMMTCG